MANEVKNELHYVNNDLIFRCQAMIDGKEVRPINVTADVYSPKKFLFTKVFYPINTDIFFKLSKKYVTIPGHYLTVFNCTIPRYGTQSHDITLNVKKQPGKGRGQ